MAATGSALWRHFHVHQIFGANTNVGKTIVSTVLCRAASRHKSYENVWYLKPVSTGPASDMDTKHVGLYAPSVKTRTLFQFDEPISPHLAAQKATNRVSDSVIVEQTSSEMQRNSKAGTGYMLVETAGGPLSPGPSGTLQLDLYRPLRLPTVFVADWQLGGISTSIASYEALKLRGYDVEGVAVLEDSYYRNFEYFESYFKDRSIPVLILPRPPDLPNESDQADMNKYYDQIDTAPNHNGDPNATDQFMERLKTYRDEHLEKLETMAAQAHKHIWYPFTQHQNITPHSLTVTDSAYGDYFQTLNKYSKPSKQESSESTDSQNILCSSVDGSASWWTQGLGHGNPSLSLAAAYAAGRYGHVMFAEAVNEPALKLAMELLDYVGNSKLQRVFYSDNGSTAMEVAVKMALKASCKRYGYNTEEHDIDILGLKCSYHGDTIGAMDLSEPSVFNKTLPWYKGRGYWFDSPHVFMKDGKWIVQKPEKYASVLGNQTKFDSLQDVFEFNRDNTDEVKRYEKYILETLDVLTKYGKRKLCALVMEPVVLGAGGMILVDPAFQRALVKVIRDSESLFSLPNNSPPHPGSGAAHDWRGLPVISDEVFTGLYRLGHRSSTSLLGFESDISVHAKLLTGGLLPLSTTLASESIFEAFLSSSKAECLLHGHSYTAHAVGCNVALESLKTFADMDYNGKWDAFKVDWADSKTFSTVFSDTLKDVASSWTNHGSTLEDSSGKIRETPRVWSVWSKKFVSNLSYAKQVEGVWALGSVLSIALKDEGGSGYTSNAAKALQQRLLSTLDGGWNIHARVLGNVLYLMSSQTSQEQDVRAWEERVMNALSS